MAPMVNNLARIKIYGAPTHYIDASTGELRPIEIEAIVSCFTVSPAASTKEVTEPKKYHKEWGGFMEDNCFEGSKYDW